MKNQKLHEEILLAVRDYRKVEAKLISLLQEADQTRLYLEYGETSLFQYCVRVLDLSDDRAYALITVARKAREVPELQKAIATNELSVSKAVRITSVLKKENPENLNWIKKAVSLPKAQLKKAVAMVNPKAATQERVKYVQAERLDLRLGISEALHSKLRAAQEIESQKKGTAATLESTLESALEAYLEKNDPVRIAKRREKFRDKKPDEPVGIYSARARLKTKTTKREPIPAKTKDQIFLRAKNQCEKIYTNPNSPPERCLNTRWLDIHHLKPVSGGGTNDLANLRLLCRVHHREVHFENPRNH